MSQTRTVSLFRNGRNQAVRIPVEFELPGEEALMRKEGDKIIIEPKSSGGDWLDVIAKYGPATDEEWPDIDDSDLPPLDDVTL
ncbi:MAG TPA: AbrB/MazE/SpoVT family DNA-binding domain-containing protein [Devosia sp.]|jgi:antitoxin VapB|nr:AbrB/MazE/SpoVT family DNA-binding domain-containing protein [Devosia sp.]